MNIINLTPHAITIIRKNGNVTIQPSGHVARVAMHFHTVTKLADGVEIVRSSAGDVVGVPPDLSQYDMALVSSMVLDALPDGSTMFYAPDTSPDSVERDIMGNIIGVRRLRCR